MRCVQEVTMLNRRDLGLAGLALGASVLTKPRLAVAQGPVVRTLKDIEGDALAELAYLLGLECYLYGFPLVMMDATNRIVTAAPKAGEYNAPMNQLLRMPGLVPPNYKDVVRISVNSVWSGGAFD